MKILIFEKLSDLHKYCANLFIDQIRTKPDSVLGFATGISPVETYKLLVKDHKENGTSWEKITTFNLDEFVGIDKNHSEAFIKQMKTNLFDFVNIPTSQINIPDSKALNPEKEARLYEEKIAKKPIDLQYISIGINGHMAYNEPKTPFNSKTHVTNLTPETIEDMVRKGKFSSFDQCPKQAITMGIQTILKYTKKAIMISFGSHKADVTKSMLEDEPNTEISASFLQLHPNCTFILDKKAASKLSEKTLKSAIWY
ncbi:glucosamine-6-phosphate deaminase [Mesomycoplasma hyopneumoniae]|uniref:glucosamine-6-phosphate deaminase n=1 Tax=Mesomycoplasma hyopneumoniae TaxID=2099 RepID=UPI0005EA1B08|nr:glucosamine-6-phosphate deaminase [Mesomycoplasma hyopneumoniae]CNR86864.1 glucosamine-6-phosphate isomerase [Salmonella enterica subsp. enterica serovar Typhimurium str. DT104]MXR12893.1 glucosamine-6-phosphate deaminase [Mesomycoplasma hyopneumoniae]MXR34412.1 glucosamine-6-phosphate deaminase [Mesomycoplasma hyopneumoniae]NYN91907.1 glucosamine-6-phosphate deaminase [Mesomycoplasma hyopneumoniae]QLG43644.1 glucosamine-6-phosphate deaminase [Mesomycoplasma hyopneumoniae]